MTLEDVLKRRAELQAEARRVEAEIEDAQRRLQEMARAIAGHRGAIAECDRWIEIMQAPEESYPRLGDQK